MANSGRRQSNSSSRGSKKSPSKSSSRSNASRKTAKTASAQGESFFAKFISKFASSKAAMPLIFLAGIILLIGIDLLVSWNSFEVFFKILGVETLIAVFVWVIMTLVFSRRSTKEPEPDSANDEV